MLKLRFDVSQYEPEEIVVKTVDNKLLVLTWYIFIMYLYYKTFITYIIQIDYIIIYLYTILYIRLFEIPGIKILNITEK